MGPNDFSDRHVRNNYNHLRVVNDIEAIYAFLKEKNYHKQTKICYG